MQKRIRAMVVVFFLFIFAGALNMSFPSSAAEDNSAVNFDISHHHIGISVPDAEASAAWYKKMFGFEVALRMNEDAANKMKIVHIKRGNCYIELFQVEGARSLPEHRRDPNADLRVHGLAHWAFQVPNVHAAVKELKAKGAEIAMEPVDTPGIAFVFIRDNAGNTFELIQYK